MTNRDSHIGSSIDMDIDSMLNKLGWYARYLLEVESVKRIADTWETAIHLWINMELLERERAICDVEERAEKPKKKTTAGETSRNQAIPLRETDTLRDA